MVGGLPPPKKTEARAMRPRAASRHLLPILIGRVRGGSAPGLPSTGLVGVGVGVAAAEGGGVVEEGKGGETGKLYS